MLNSKYSSTPYDTTRPKVFFGDRKKLYVEEITRGSGGKSYNPSWNANRKPSVKKLYKGGSDESPYAIMIIAPISIYIGVILISILSVM